jgi:hypothetical protein
MPWTWRNSTQINPPITSSFSHFFRHVSPRDYMYLVLRVRVEEEEELKEMMTIGE